MMETLREYYIVRTLKKARTGDEPSIHYWAIDQASGGYPYWSQWTVSANEFKSIQDAINAVSGKYDQYMLNDLHGPLEIAKVTWTAEKVDDLTPALEAEKRERALAKLTEDEKTLLGL